MRSMLTHTDNATRPNLIFRLFICAPPIELTEFESANPRRLLVKQRCDMRVRGPCQATVKVDRTLTQPQKFLSVLLASRKGCLPRLLRYRLLTSTINLLLR